MEYVIIVLIICCVLWALVATGSGCDTNRYPDGYCVTCRKNITEDGYTCGKC